MFYFLSADVLTSTMLQTIAQPNPLSVHSIKFVLLPVLWNLYLQFTTQISAHNLIRGPESPMQPPNHGSERPTDSGNNRSLRHDRQSRNCRRVDGTLEVEAINVPVVCYSWLSYSIDPPPWFLIRLKNTALKMHDLFALCAWVFTAQCRLHTAVVNVTSLLNSFVLLFTKWHYKKVFDLTHNNLSCNFWQIMYDVKIIKMTRETK